MPETEITIPGQTPDLTVSVQKSVTLALSAPGQSQKSKMKKELLVNSLQNT